MERLTSNKKVSDMSMIELAHNSCYADNERKCTIQRLRDGHGRTRFCEKPYGTH